MESKILVINGPNINILSLRDPEIYGTFSYETLEELCKMSAQGYNRDIEVFQSNHEGAIIDKIQESYGSIGGLVINAGAYSHTSIAIMDALQAMDYPVVELHLSDIHSREEYRRHSYISEVAERVICGHGILGYAEAIEYLCTRDMEE